MLPRILALVTLLGAGCAARPDRGAVAPPDVVTVASDLAVTCGAPDAFAHEHAASDRSCHRVADVQPEAAIDERGSDTARARAAAEFLAGTPADPPVDRRAMAAALHRAPGTTRERPLSSTPR